MRHTAATALKDLNVPVKDAQLILGHANIIIITSLTRQIVLLVPLIALLPIWFGIEGILFAGPIADCFAAVVVILIAVKELKKLKSH
jgi:Na+-driven multidrug efflux pump